MIWQEQRSNILYKLRMLWQRITRGFSDYEVFTFQQHFARWVVPRLKRTLELKQKIGIEICVEEWEEMISGFELVINNESGKIDRPGTIEFKALNKSLKLYHKLFWNLSY